MHLSIFINALLFLHFYLSIYLGVAGTTSWWFPWTRPRECATPNTSSSSHSRWVTTNSFWSCWMIILMQLTYVHMVSRFPCRIDSSKSYKIIWAFGTSLPFPKPFFEYRLSCCWDGMFQMFLDPGLAPHISRSISLSLTHRLPDS